MSGVVSGGTMRESSCLAYLSMFEQSGPLPFFTGTDYSSKAQLDVFVSHAWQTPGRWKHLSLLVQYGCLDPDVARVLIL